MPSKKSYSNRRRCYTLGFLTTFASRNPQLSTGFALQIYPNHRRNPIKTSLRKREIRPSVGKESRRTSNSNNKSAMKKEPIYYANHNFKSISVTRQDFLQFGLVFSWFLVASIGFQPAWSSERDDDNRIPEECQDGSLVTESAVPGAYQQVCMSLPERTITLKATGDVITVKQGPAVGAGQTGVAVWNSCLLLTRLLDEVSSASSSWLNNKTVLELGCGTGLACIAASKLGSSSVIATDGNPDVVDLAQTNVELNGLSDNVVATRTMKWGIMNAMDFVEVADVVIGSDLTYNSGTWKVLAETLSTVLKPNGFVLYLTLGHAGFDVTGELNGFLSVATSEGLEIVQESSPDWPLPVPSLTKLLEKSITLKETAVLAATGGVRVVILRNKPAQKA